MFIRSKDGRRRYHHRLGVFLIALVAGAVVDSASGDFSSNNTCPGEKKKGVNYNSR